MDLVTLAIWAAILLTAVGVLAIVLFGLKSAASGRIRVGALIGLSVPVVIFGISYAISAGSPTPFAEAAILTSLILMGIAMLALVIIGLRGFVGF
jgi:hypothetical protein